MTRSAMKQKSLVRACVATACLLATAGTWAQAAASPLSFNASVTTDYRYRGISQTRLEPALQGGVDYAHSSGLYVGAWASTIKWIRDNGVKGDVELDLYGGYKTEISKGTTIDVGVLQYAYVLNKLKDTGGGGVYKNADTTELYGALTFGPVTAKLSYALTDLFGQYNFAEKKSSKGSIYVDLSGTFDLGSGLTLVPHVGYQKVENVSDATYTDYSLSLTKDLGSGFSVTGAVVGTDAKKSYYVPGASANSAKYLGRTSFVASAKYAF
jgi:uncharacterized protein (TIGR02001 family)